MEGPEERQRLHADREKIVHSKDSADKNVPFSLPVVAVFVAVVAVEQSRGWRIGGFRYGAGDGS